MNFGDSNFRLDLANGVPSMTTTTGTTVGDDFHAFRSGSTR